MKRFTPRFAFLLLAPLLVAATARAQERVITKAIEVRSLPVAEADRGIEANLRGVVVFVEGPSAVFVQDESSTTFFRTNQTPLPNVGDDIEVRGATRMGLYLPGLDFSTFRILGHRALPPGIPARYDDLVFSRYHYQRVALEGIVRSISPVDPQRSLIRLAMGSRVLEARVEQPPQDGRSLVDHRVRVTGLAVGFINKRRQLVQSYVRVLDWNEVEVLAPATPIAEVPHISAEELLAFRIAGHGQQRVWIEGGVTAVFSRDQVFLRQGEMAFGVRLSVPTTLSPGDRVAIMGFPEMDRFSASVVDAELVSRQPGPALAPVRLPSPDDLGELHDGNLVSVAGTVRDVFKTDGGTALLLQGKTRTLQARLPEGVEAPANGSRVQITGICQVETVAITSGFTSQPGIVSLRARSASDLEILQKPSWWTARRLTLMLGILAATTLLAGLWIAILRRQVRWQTEALRRRIESEATLEERQRIAREFHDTFEQELAGVSLRLDALATRELDEKGRGLITGSRNLVSRMQTETRDLIGDLRDSTEAAGDLAAALIGVAARHSAESGANVRVAPAAAIPALAPAIVHDLRMIARESVTNSLEHGRATDATIALSIRATQLVMTIADNGCGFDATAATQGKRGHFGCVGMRERARKIGAEISWASVLQKGTTVEVTLPLPTRGDTASAAAPDNSQHGEGRGPPATAAR